MNDRTILTENSRDDGLPSEAKIDERIAEINLRQQKRRQIIEHLESGSIAEAWKCTYCSLKRWLQEKAVGNNILTDSLVREVRPEGSWLGGLAQPVGRGHRYGDATSR